MQPETASQLYDNSWVVTTPATAATMQDAGLQYCEAALPVSGS